MHMTVLRPKPAVSRSAELHYRREMLSNWQQPEKSSEKGEDERKAMLTTKNELEQTNKLPPPA